MSEQLGKNLRRKQTDAERYLWQCLRNRQLESFKFRRQISVLCLPESGRKVESAYA